MTIAAGIFLIKKDETILVGHPTHHKSNFWSIPKGRVETGETQLLAAIRELKEEANVDISSYSFVYTLPSSQYSNGKKILVPFVLFEDENGFVFNEFELKCNSYVENEFGSFPEMDDFKWISIEEARTSLHATQVACLDYIVKLINEKK